MTTRFDLLEARESMAGRQGYAEGVAAASGLVAEQSVVAFKGALDREAIALRALAADIAKLKAPALSKTQRRLADKAIEALSADDTEWLVGQVGHA